jgi:hypothetical protein
MAETLEAVVVSFDFLKRGPRPVPYTENELVADANVGPHEQLLYKAYIKALRKHGPFNKGAGEGGLQYISADTLKQHRLPFADEGIRCENCVFFNNLTFGCYLLGNDGVEPDGFCKLWVIPEEFIGVGYEEPSLEPTMAMPEPTAALPAAPVKVAPAVGVAPVEPQHLPLPQAPPRIDTPRAPAPAPSLEPLITPTEARGGAAPVNGSVTDMKKSTAPTPQERPTPPQKAGGGLKHSPRPTPVSPRREGPAPKQKPEQRGSKGKRKDKPQRGKRLSDSAWWMR